MAAARQPTAAAAAGAATAAAAAVTSTSGGGAVALRSAHSASRAATGLGTTTTTTTASSKPSSVTSGVTASGRRTTSTMQPLPSKVASSTVDAAALQDHLMRSLGVDLRGPAPSRAAGRSGPPPPTATAAAAARHAPPRPNKVKAGPLTAIGDATALASAVARRWTCDACGAMAAAGATACSSCGAARAAEVVTVAPTLTLAQQRGLVPAPPPLLSSTDWDAIEKTAAARAAAAAAADAASAGTAKIRTVDAAGMCAICMEPFGLREQALLSCSHVFHRSCIDSFERFVGWAKRSCPLCRATGYEKRRTRQAATDYVQRCATAVQAAYRGHVTRCAFFAMRQALYLPRAGADGAAPAAGVAIDARRKRAFMADMLGDLARRLRVAHAEHATKLTALLSELDASMAASRATVAAAEARLAARLAARGGGGGAASAAPLPAPAVAAAATRTPPASSGDTGAAARLLQDITARVLAAEERSAALQAARAELLERGAAGGGSAAATAAAAAAAAAAEEAAAPAPAPLTPAAWGSVLAAATARGATEGDCAICITALCDRGRKALSLLSCGHVYHAQCMTALEAFAAQSAGAAATAPVAMPPPPATPVPPSVAAALDVASQTAPPRGARCPVCRALYLRVALLRSAAAGAPR